MEGKDVTQIMSALTEVKTQLSSIDEKVETIKKDFEKLDDKLDETHNRQIVQGKDIESNQKAIHDLWEAHNKFKNNVGEEVRAVPANIVEAVKEGKAQAVEESTQKIKLWLLTALIPAMISIMVSIGPYIGKMFK